jgi:hypothetical protein
VTSSRADGSVSVIAEFKWSTIISDVHVSIKRNR